MTTDLSETFRAMFAAESSTEYKCCDYLALIALDGVSSSVTDPDELSKTSERSRVTNLWREKICEWCFKIVDHFDIDRELVSIVLSYLDRFMSKNVRNLNKITFQLASLTSLYLAFKLYVLDPNIRAEYVVQLSKDVIFTEMHIFIMERHLLR